MNHRFFLLLTLFTFVSQISLLAPNLSAQDADTVPGPPPEMCQVWIENDLVYHKVLVPYTETITQTVQVEVPYTEELADGRTITRMRMETETREVQVTRFRTETRASSLDAIEFSTKSGQAVEVNDRLKTSLTKPRPALIVYQEKTLSKFYQPFFSENVVVMHFKSPQPDSEIPSPFPVDDDVVAPPVVSDDDGA